MGKKDRRAILKRLAGAKINAGPGKVDLRDATLAGGFPARTTGGHNADQAHPDAERTQTAFSKACIGMDNAVR